MPAVAPADDLTSTPELDYARSPVWRVPLELVLATSDSVYVAHTLKQVARPGRGPFPDAFVFERGSRFFGLVDFHGVERPSLLLPLRAHSLGLDRSVPPFGRRQPLPFGLQENR